MNCSRHYVSSPDFSELFRFALKWTPRSAVAGLAGYYCLGIAYNTGIMAAIDRLTMHILRPSMGYMGMAIFMPTFQWYSAWGVRVVSAIVSGFLYDLAEKTVCIAFRTISLKSTKLPLFEQTQKSLLFPETSIQYSSSTQCMSPKEKLQ